MDPKLQEEKTRLANERELAQFEKSQRRLGELVILFCYLDSIKKRVTCTLVGLCAYSSLRFKTTLHCLLLYPRYASSMQQIHGEVSSIGYSVQSSVQIKTDLSP